MPDLSKRRLKFFLTADLQEFGGGLLGIWVCRAAPLKTCMGLKSSLGVGAGPGVATFHLPINHP
jgi:hypothetical protein